MSGTDKTVRLYESGGAPGDKPNPLPRLGMSYTPQTHNRLGDRHHLKLPAQSLGSS